MAQLHKWVAEHGSRTSRNNGAEEAGEIESKLVDRFTARVSIWVRSNAHRLWRQHVITWREVAEDTTRVIT
jgi:hypothetical protein